MLVSRKNPSSNARPGLAPSVAASRMDFMAVTIIDAACRADTSGAAVAAVANRQLLAAERPVLYIRIYIYIYR